MNPGRSTAEQTLQMVCFGDVPTLETLAAVDLLRRHLPTLKCASSMWST
jgi:phosphoketolase